MSIKVRSPVGSFVVDIMIDDGAVVQKGQTLLRLDDEDERQEIARLTKFKTLSQESVEQLTGEVVQKKIEILNLSIDVAESYHIYMQYAFEAAKERQMIGEITLVDVKQIEAELQEAKAKAAKANIMRQLFDDNITHNLKVARLSLDHSDAELDFAKQKLAETQIKSPSSGIVKLRVGVGSYAKQGGVLAVIES